MANAELRRECVCVTGAGGSSRAKMYRLKCGAAAAGQRPKEFHLEATLNSMLVWSRASQLSPLNTLVAGSMYRRRGVSVKTRSLSLSKNKPHSSFFLNFPQNITRSPWERYRM